jgi:Fe-S-cluster containining protein
VTDDEALPAGRFSEWLAGMERALRGLGESDVPCGGCTACCSSSQFVHIAPDETTTLARIPTALLFPAPRLPAGHVLLGYDEHGRCPMLIDGGCSIYEDRPRTCRTYDCRVFPAAAVAIDDDLQRAIGERALRWRFDLPTEKDRVELDAVQAAARYVAEREDALPKPEVPTNATQHAVLAVRLHHAFLGEDGRSVVADPDPEAINEVLKQ